MSGGAVPSLGIRLPPCDRADRIADAAAHAERLGFDNVWLPDSQLLWRDVFTALTAVALRTERVGLGTAVTNLVTRHPAVVASAARSIAELAPGRFHLGVGVGNSSVGPVGLRSSTRAELTERLTQVRALLRGEEWDYGSTRSRLRDPGPAVPIHLAASGPKNLRYAGEAADGVILLSGIAPANLADSLDRVREGARSAGRDPADIQVTASAYCHVTDDVERDARILKPVCATIARYGGRTSLALAGIEVDVPERFDEGEVYPDLIHAEDWDLAVEVAGRWVSDEAAVKFARAFCLFGTTGEIGARLAELGALGVTGLLVQHVGSYSLPYELMDALGDVLARSGSRA
ncbi:LLM class flavin-dependent oxidoreductase [Streptosporangium vulgare]|uniref:LLM class flavin-dependent oxidoreductase n=1 Tax=Streptosporangium vulgare TaxID=46190 RepID=A0ABV5TE51_9ACTN